MVTFFTQWTMKKLKVALDKSSRSVIDLALLKGKQQNGALSPFYSTWTDLVSLVKLTSEQMPATWSLSVPILLRAQQARAEEVIAAFDIVRLCSLALFLKKSCWLVHWWPITDCQLVWNSEADLPWRSGWFHGVWDLMFFETRCGYIMNPIQLYRDAMEKFLVCTRHRHSHSTGSWTKVTFKLSTWYIWDYCIWRA